MAAPPPLHGSSPPRRHRSLAILAVGALACGAAAFGALEARPSARPAGAAAPPTTIPAAGAELPSWFTDAKLGIFIHWGVYSVPAWAPVGSYAEWYWLFSSLPIFPQYQHHLDTYGPEVRYDDFIPQFTAERWDPTDWIDLIGASGAKYWVFTTKHHDGFELWPSSSTDRNSVELGPKRDLVGDLMEANEGSGLKAGLYYSIPEWFNPAPVPARYSDMYDGLNEIFETFDHPFDPYEPDAPPLPYTGYKPISDYATGQVIPDVTELVDRYHPSILWCDIGGDPDYFQSQRLIDHFKADGATAHPEGVVVNNRCGLPGDYDTPEYQPVPDAPARYFEATRGLGSSFGFNRNEQLDDYLTDDQVIRTLIDTVAAGGNLLLDIGPEADGTIPQVMRDRLLALGAWLDVNGDAIYATEPGPATGSCTQRSTISRDGTVNIIELGRPADELRIEPDITLGPDARVTLLGGDGAPLDTRVADGRLVVSLPEGAPDGSSSAYVLRITDATAAVRVGTSAPDCDPEPTPTTTPATPGTPPTAGGSATPGAARPVAGRPTYAG
ncbi:MAG: alpha-L-fucosidase [Actinobacteria bacterium]|nr:alpha-L-fucosidase [Actinomycetota bacterium]